MLWLLHKRLGRRIGWLTGVEMIAAHTESGPVIREVIIHTNTDK